MNRIAVICLGSLILVTAVLFTHWVSIGAPIPDYELLSKIEGETK